MRRITLYMMILILAVSLVCIVKAFINKGVSPEPDIDLSEPVSPKVEEEKSPDITHELPKPVSASKAKKPIKYPDLRLEATMTTGMPSAYIRVLTSGKADFYSIGDKVSGATLMEIERGKVLLSLEDNLYSIYIGSGTSVGLPQEDSGSFKIVKRADMLDVINSNESGVNALAELTPHRDREGNFNGYLIDGVKKTSPVYWAGLRNGDIVKNINGQQLLSPQKAVQTFKRIRKLKDIEIGLLRDTSNITKSYSVE